MAAGNVVHTLNREDERGDTTVTQLIGVCRHLGCKGVPFVEGSTQVCRNRFRNVEVFGSVPSLDRQNIAVLAFLIASTQEDYSAVLYEIDPMPGAVVDPKFANALANRLRVPEKSK